MIQSVSQKYSNVIFLSEIIKIVLKQETLYIWFATKSENRHGSVVLILLFTLYNKQV